MVAFDWGGLPQGVQLTYMGRVFRVDGEDWLSYPGRSAVSLLAIRAAWANDGLRTKMSDDRLWRALGTWNGSRFTITEAARETEWRDSPERCERGKISHRESRDIIATILAHLDDGVGGVSCHLHSTDDAVVGMSVTIPIMTEAWIEWAAQYPIVELLPVIEIRG